MSLWRRNTTPPALPGGTPNGPSRGRQARNNVKMKTSNAIGSVFNAGKKAGKAVVQTGKDVGNRTGEKLTDYKNKDKTRTNEELDAYLQAQRLIIETYPQHVTFEPLRSHGVLQGFESNQLPYSLHIVDQIKEGTDIYYVVQQVDKVTGKKGKYAFVNQQGMSLTLQSATHGTIGPLFFHDYEFVDQQHVRVQGSPSGPYETAALDLSSVPAAPVPSSYQTAVAQGIYNKNFPENQVFIVKYRTLMRQLNTFLGNDILTVTSNLTPQQRRNLDIDAEPYFVQWRTLLDEFTTTNGGFYRDLVGYYPSKHQQFDYYKNYMETMWTRRTELRKNSDIARAVYINSIQAQFKNMFHALTGERL